MISNGACGHETTSAVWGNTDHNHMVDPISNRITISKWHSCLKGDIVEALQCIKCAIQHDLLFQEPAPSLISEAEETSNQELEDAKEFEESDVEEILWDGLLIDNDNDNGETMYWSE